MSGISTHVLDMHAGKPAVGLSVRLEELSDGSFVELTAQTTDDNGRCSDLLSIERVRDTRYRIVFDVGNYFHADGVMSLFPEITITFSVEASGTNYHIPLLLAANGYTTYRGT